MTYPETTAKISEGIARAARASAPPDIEVIPGPVGQGPETIEAPFDSTLAVPGMLARVKSAGAGGAQAQVLAGFDGTGTDAARALPDAPVVGIEEAAMHLASLLGHSFEIVTTLSRSEPIFDYNAPSYGVSRRCRTLWPATFPS